MTFGFSVDALNADALSRWEFDQMYGPDEQKHVNGESLGDVEFFARIMWFPVDALTMRLTLPESAGTVRLSEFRHPDSQAIERKEVRTGALLRVSPRRASEHDPFHKPWPRQQPGETSDKPVVIPVSPQTWEMSVKEPPVGSCYSLDWGLPEIVQDHRSRQIAKKANQFRRKLLEVRRELRNQPQGELASIVHSRLAALDEDLRTIYNPAPADDVFEVSLMTYDEDERRLLVVDGFENGKAPPEDFFAFWLPFGLGQAGAAFKQGRAYSYVRLAEDEADFGLEFYLPLPQRQRHEVLMAVPLSHPDYYEGAQIERSRQCVGVIDVGWTRRDGVLRDWHSTQTKRNTWLRAAIGSCAKSTRRG